MLLHALIPASRANGPGLRAVVFFQGCTLACRGCFNPDTHPYTGTEVAAEAVAERLLRAHKEHGVEGVTFSGGEPMQQADSLLRLIQGLRRQAPELSFGLFSGYSDLELVLGRYGAVITLSPSAADCGKTFAISSTSPFSGVSIKRSPAACPCARAAVKRCACCRAATALRTTAHNQLK
jgi:hypothetical protein